MHEHGRPVCYKNKLDSECDRDLSPVTKQLGGNNLLIALPQALSLTTHVLRRREAFQCWEWSIPLALLCVCSRIGVCCVRRRTLPEVRRAVFYTK